MSMRIDVIVNANARRFAAEPWLLERVRRVCGGAAVIHPTATIADLDDAARTIAARGSDLVLLTGGDGTFMAGVTAVARAFGEDRLPKIGLVPGGTVATVARNWGSTGDPHAVLERLLRAPERLEAIARPTLRVRATLEGKDEERLGFIFGTGLVASFFDVYYADGARGYQGAARIVARIFAESFWGGPLARRVLDPMPCSIEVEGRKLDPSAWSLVCAAVVRDLGIHMLVTYRAGEDPSRLHLVASPLSSRALGPRAPLVLAGRSIGGRGHFDDLVRDFVVRFPTVGPYVLDGDVLRAESVRVAPGPKIEVVVPPR
ncbi:DAG-kinase catalytic domain protein [Minicystis rosea]|nr:DAG-kinase catalytic domain protein [Minicystis rosea]